MLVAGELVLRRVGRAAAAAVFGAAIGILLVAAYAGNAYYGFYGTGAAQALVLLAAAAGVAVSLRADAASVAAVGLVGGFLAPAVLTTSSPSPVALWAYLLSVELMAVATAALREAVRWRALRGLALAGVAVWAGAVLQTAAFRLSPATPVFLVASAALFHAELITSTLRAKATTPMGGPQFALLVTALLTAGVLVVYADAAWGLRVTWVLGLAVAATVPAIVFRRTSRACTRRLGGGYAIQAFALVATACWIAFPDVGVPVGWVVLAVAMAMTAGRTDVPAGRVVAVGLWVLAGVDLVRVANGSGERTVFSLFRRAGSRVLARRGRGHGCRLRAGEHADAPLVGAVRRGDGSGGVVRRLGRGAAADVGDAGDRRTGRRDRRALDAGRPAPRCRGRSEVHLRRHAVAGGCCPRETGPGADRFSIRLPEPPRYSSLAIVAAGHRAGRYAGAVLAGAALLLTYAVGLELDRIFQNQPVTIDRPLVEAVTLSVWGALAAAVCVAGGFLARVPPLRYAGLGLFAATLLKVVLVDTARLGPGYRVLCFAGVGALLLLTSILYGKDNRSTGKTSKSDHSVSSVNHALTVSGQFARRPIPIQGVDRFDKCLKRHRLDQVTGDI